MKIENWLNELETYSTNQDIVKMLVGNKCDMTNDRAVSKEDGLKCARKHQMMFIEASAKTREGVQCAFEELVEKIIQTPTLWEVTDEQRRKASTLRVGGNQEEGGYLSSCGC